MKRINVFIVILLTVSLHKTFATVQEPDIIIYKGDTLLLNANPLELFYKNELERPQFFGNKKGCMSTACWRDYRAEWTIIDNELYLTGIFSCCYREDNLKANLNELFGNKCINSKVKADWVTGNIFALTGKYICVLHSIDAMIYEGELEFQINKGKLVGTKLFDNSKSRQSNYSQSDNLRLEYIYNNINWKLLPLLDNEKIRVIVEFSANEKGIIDSVKILKGNDKVYDDEAIRVIKTIPNWNIYYRHGKLVREHWVQSINFSKENREKYKL